MSALTDWSDGEITELMAERDAALTILRDLVTSRDGVVDFDCEVIVARARKLLGDI